ncbi:hypothetical protein GCM10007094_23120 [Pseudovibrio japonicus]|uniref:PDZ domain-containing protein n=1 Tax=Pseudovibrio japonicus TaxID=366534 RepID=A0ABQ3EG89_9HYPH|nr:hypothetical protein [Pseudovibrio japonicus]GHB33694.1 hypothetical protein GCM10007094_23120 [Pseudovibrio japonicus]
MTGEESIVVRVRAAKGGFIATVGNEATSHMGIVGDELVAVNRDTLQQTLEKEVRVRLADILNRLSPISQSSE